MEDQFAREQILIGKDALSTLASCRVAVFGIGGVGGYAVEALARAGVGALELVDPDEVDMTNINRQIIATHQTVGRPKVEVAAERVLSINPNCRVTTRRCFFLPSTAQDFDFTSYDYIVDAVDTTSAKLALIEAAHAAGTPLICSMGTGNKLDPTAFRVADISQTSIDPLAKIIRKELRKRGILHQKVVYSTEPPRKPADPAIAPRVKEGSRPAPGSISFVPAAAGLALAGAVVCDLIQNTSC